jgi:hypothetical protein
LNAQKSPLHVPLQCGPRPANQFSTFCFLRFVGRFPN